MKKGMMEISYIKSPIEAWEHIRVPTIHDTDKVVSRLHLYRDRYDCSFNQNYFKWL